MQGMLNGLCRGSEKVFISFSVTDNGDANEISSTVKADDNIIPSRCYERGRGVVCCFPSITNAKSYNVTLLEDASAREVSLSANRILWESRLSYKLNRGLCSDIRDFDKRAEDASYRIEFDGCIQDRDTNVLRGRIAVPATDDIDISLKCFTQEFNLVSDEFVRMGYSTVATGQSTDSSYVDYFFSLRIPTAANNYIIAIIDEHSGQYKGFDVLLKSEYVALCAKMQMIMQNAQLDGNYPQWFEVHRATSKELEYQRGLQQVDGPTFSLIVPLYKTPLPFFSEMVESVLSQTYQKWELVLVNASPDFRDLDDGIDRYGKADDRIKSIALNENLGISCNTNEGIAAANGDYIAFFDHDDVLEPNILFEYAKAIKSSGAELLYCDEDKLLPDGTFSQPFFKPDFNIDLLRNNNYICHMLAIKKSLLDELPLNTKEFDGAQDHNLTLHAVEHTSKIAHISKVLYHWRVSESSTAGNSDSKSYASNAGIRAVQNHLNRVGLSAKVTLSRRPFTYDVKYDVPKSKPLVSIIIPSKDHIDLLDQCIASICELTTYDNYEIIIVENNSEDENTFAYYDSLTSSSDCAIRVESWHGEFNFSKIVNYGRSKAKGDYLLLLNNDTKVISSDWIDRMLGICSRADVGAVGAQLYYPDDTTQHAGVCIVGGVACHLSKDVPRGSWGYFALNDAQQDLSAVTAACVMTDTASFDEVGGFTEDLAVAFNDIDYCLKLRSLNKQIVYAPDVELYHFESISRGAEDSPEKRIRFHKECAYMNYHWAEYYIKGNPFSNPNFSKNELERTYYRLGW